MKKLLTYSVVIATIVWSLGLAAVVPLATAAYSPSAGDLVKTANDSAVYYIDSEGNRHLFSNEVTYWTWYSGTWADQDVMTISQDDFDALGVGDNVTARPGVNLVKFENSPKTYAVLPGGVLAHITDEAAAIALFGSSWLSKVILIQNAFETNYSKTGGELTSSSNLPNGSLIKYEGSEDIYYIEDGMKRLVADDAFVANNFKDSAVLTVPTSMTFDSGESITGEEAGLTTVAGPEAPGGGATSGTSLSAALASDTPAAGLAVYNAARVPFTTVSVTASADGDITIDSVTVKREGAASDSVFSSVALIDAGTNVQIGTNQNLNASSKAVFSNDIVVPAGTTKKLLVAGNMSNTGAGQIPQLAVTAIALKGGASLVASLPITGNGQTMTNLTIGQVTVSRGTYQNSTSTDLKVGTTGYIISSLKFDADSVESQRIKQIKYYQIGTASLSNDLDNYQLLLNNSTVIDAEFTVDGKYVTAEFSDDSVLVEKGKNVQLVLKADVVGGSTRTVKMGVYRNTDIVAAGDSFGYTRTAAYSGTGTSGTDTPVITNDQYTISAGTLRIESSSAVEAQDVAYGDDQEVGAFNFVVQGEAVDITALTLTISSSTAGSDTFDNVRLVSASGETLWGPSSPSSGSVAYTSNVQLPVGDNVIKVVADVESTAGFASNETFYFSVAGSSITATGVETDDTITASPTSAVSTYTQTFKSAKLTITANALPTDSNVVLGAKDHVYGSWVFSTTGSGEDVKITAITFGNPVGTTTNLNNLRLVNASNGDTIIDTSHNGDSFTSTSTWTLTTPLTITKNTSINLELWADVRTTAATYQGHIDEFVIRNDGTTAPVSAEGVNTGNTVTPTGSAYDATDGADITIVGAGTLTVDGSANTPASRIVAEGQTYEVSRLKLTADNEALDITDLSICVGTGGTSGTETGDKDDITTVSVYKSTDMSSPIISSSLNAVCEAFALNQGDLEVPEGTSGVELVIKATMANIDNSVVEETGAANASIILGIGGTNSIAAKGAVSGLTVSTETINTASGSAMTLHKSYPEVTVYTANSSGNELASKLANGAILYDLKVSNPTNEPIAIYRLSFLVSTSSGDTDVTSGGLEAKLTGWSSYKKIAADSAGTINDGTNDRYFSFALWNPDSTSVTQKELQIGAGKEARFHFIGRTIAGLDGTTGESIEIEFLGDTASSTVDDDSGNVAAGFTSLEQGNFVWSDLYENTGTSSNGATSTAQWYNGYLVEGLQSTSTLISIPE